MGYFQLDNPYTARMVTGMTSTLTRIAHRAPGLFIIGGILLGWALVAGLFIAADLIIRGLFG